MRLALPCPDSDGAAPCKVFGFLFLVACDYCICTYGRFERRRLGFGASVFPVDNGISALGFCVSRSQPRVKKMDRDILEIGYFDPVSMAIPSFVFCILCSTVCKTAACG